MAWITPKTDWFITSVFSYTDYNRIKNNLLYINDMLNEKYPDKAQVLDLGDDIDYSVEYKPSQFNAFENALESFTRIGINLNYGSKFIFTGNSNFIDYNELNRIEKSCLRWYEMNPPITSISVSPSTFDLEVETSLQLVLSVVPSDAEYTAVWSSSNINVLDVDSNGLVTAVADGVANITVVVKQSRMADKSVTVVGRAIQVDNG